MMENTNLNLQNCCCCLVVKSCPTLHDPMDQSARPSHLPLHPGVGSNLYWSLRMTLSNHLVLCHPLLFLSSHFPYIRVFSRESSLLMRWPKYWSLSFRICPSSEHSGLISFKMDRFVLLAVQGTRKSLLQHHNSKASIFSVVSLLYGQALASVHCYWKNHSFDYSDLAAALTAAKQHAPLGIFDQTPGCAT